MLAARYDAEAREISNWRTETLAALEPKPVAIAAALLNADRPVITRCVKLNNYWCIKSARWDGEIGRIPKAMWASPPPTTGLTRRLICCGATTSNSIENPPSISSADGRRRNATSPPASAALRCWPSGASAAPCGRSYLASRRGKGVTTFTVTGRGGKPGRVSMVHSDQNTAIPGARYRGRNGREAKPTATKPFQRPKCGKASRRPPKIASAAPVAACAPDEQRLRNYASRMVVGLKVGPTDDLQLFARDGMPSENLAAVMTAMASFELGMLRPTDALIDAALRRAVLRAEAAKATDREGPKL